MAVGDTLTFTEFGIPESVPEGITVQNPAVGVFDIASQATISGLGIGGLGISESVRINASVDNLSANTGAGDDRLVIGGDVNNSSIEMGTGRDNLIVAGDFNNSGVDSGAGRDVLRFEGNVQGSYINAGADDDLVGFLGDVNGSVIDLGTGNDQVRFSGDVTNTRLDLGGGADVVRLLDPNADTTGLVIEGASDNDVLFIGSSQYSYQGDFTWQNIADPTDEQRFGP